MDFENWQTGSCFTGELVISIDFWDKTHYRLLKIFKELLKTALKIVHIGKKTLKNCHLA